MAEWDVELHPEVHEWFMTLCQEDPVSAELLEMAIDMLAREGPALGRPMVDLVTRRGGQVRGLARLVRPQRPAR
jgi:hypothetical protein